MSRLTEDTSEHLEVSFEEAMEIHREYLKPRLVDTLEGHLTKVDATNRGKMSRASTQARKGPGHEDIRIKMQNTASLKTLCHELGHALMNVHGYDCTQEATNRANNKSNYSRWPQFSWGKKDSPVERFMFRRYGDLPDIRRIPFVDLDHHADRADIFHFENKSHPWYETHCYRSQSDITLQGKRHEAKRYEDPIIMRDGEPYSIRVRQLPSSIGTLDIQPDRDGVTVVDRYELTPGLTEVLEEDHQIEWSGLDRVVHQVNTMWHEAATFVRKRGEKRRRGMKMAPAGKSKSYYLMNAHEYFAEFHSRMLLNVAKGDFDDSIERLWGHVPHLIETYQEEMLR